MLSRPRARDWMHTQGEDEDGEESEVGRYEDEDGRISRGRAVKRRKVDLDDDEDEDDEEEDDEEEEEDEERENIEKGRKRSARSGGDFREDEDEDDDKEWDEDEDEDDGDEDEAERGLPEISISIPLGPKPSSTSLPSPSVTTKSKAKIKSSDPSTLSASSLKKTGIIYLSRLPPHMKPTKLRHLLSSFGPINRIFLNPESPLQHKRRARNGGNKKVLYEEGWVEFLNKKDAKFCALSLNANQVGGKKRNWWYDDVWNMKYLRGFKWGDLTEQIANENASRAARLRAEISQATRENKTYIRNVERAKMVENMQATAAAKREKETSSDKSAAANSSKRKADNDDQVEIDIRRTFRQKTAVSKAVDSDINGNGNGLVQKKQKSESMKKLLNSVF